MSVRTRRPPPPERRPGAQIAIIVLAVLALASLALEFGFDRPPLPIVLLEGIQLAVIALYVGFIGFTLVKAKLRPEALRRHALDVILIVLGIGMLIVSLPIARTTVLKIGSIYVGVMQVLLVVRAVAGGVQWNLEMSHRPLHPARLLVGSFGMVILAGALLLALPRALVPGLLAGVDTGTHLLNALFMATSATCVTGLSVYDIGGEYSLFGQVVILVLIQLGGLGIMIATTVLGLLVGQRLSLRQSLVMQDTLSHETIGRIRQVVLFVFVATVTCETVGALLCYPMSAEYAPAGRRVFFSVFHAVSAFCNAGFALQGDSLVALRGTWGMYVGLMPLIIVGGLGFPVLDDLWRGLATWWRRPQRPAPSPMARAQIRVWRRRSRYRLTLHTRLVLWTTGTLIVVPAVLFFLFETFADLPATVDAARGVPMAALSTIDRVGAALFQSVTARTAGFNSVPLDDVSMSPASHFLLAVMMFIGGSPASTAGGVKTVAIAVLTIGVVDTLRGRTRFEAFGRTIPELIVERAAVVVFVMFGVVSIITLLLCLTENAPFRDILFESVSACGTVGLSTGLTGQLSTLGRLLIMIAMFAGRLGPVTLLIALAGGAQPARYSYPEEQVIIG